MKFGRLLVSLALAGCVGETDAAIGSGADAGAAAPCVSA